MPTAAADVSEKSIQAAKDKLNAHVQEIVRWHFDPATGSPFWLERAKSFDFDPMTEVNTYQDLDKFGFFQDEWLRGGPVRRWVPKAFADSPIYTFETGGSTGVPKSRINVNDFRIDYENFSETLPDEFFPRGADWLHVGPSGPRRLRLAIEHLAQHRGGMCFMVDLDPRWVIKLIKSRQMDQMEAYKRHVIDQALTLLRAHPGIQCLFTTPKLLEALCEKVSLKSMGIKGVFCGGTEMTPQFHRFAVEELLDGHLLRADLRQHADGPGDAQDPGRSGGQLRDHLLPAGAARDDRGRQSRSARPAGRVRQNRPRPSDDADEGVLHAALPRARRSRARASVRRVPLGRRPQRPALLEVRDDGGRRACIDTNSQLRHNGTSGPTTNEVRGAVRLVAFGFCELGEYGEVAARPRSIA